MNVQKLAPVLLIGGLVVLLVSIFANPLGIGTDPSRFGWLQWLGVVVGLVAGVAGALLIARKPR
jgi:steroid 5-alpha reductase family enzyme